MWVNLLRHVFPTNEIKFRKHTPNSLRFQATKMKYLSVEAKICFPYARWDTLRTFKALGEGKRTDDSIIKAT